MIIDEDLCDTDRLSLDSLSVDLSNGEGILTIEVVDYVEADTGLEPLFRLPVTDLSLTDLLRLAEVLALHYNPDVSAIMMAVARRGAEIVPDPEGE